MPLKKQDLRQRLISKKVTLTALLNKIYRGEETYSTIWNILINTAKIFIVAARKFIKDDCFTKASSITYTIILSLVPILTIGLTVYSLYYGIAENKKELFDKILHLLSDYSIKVNIEPIFEVILGLIENAGKIGGISALIIIFSATAMLRSLEKSFNAIWKVKKGRPVLLKIVYYWSALTLGPLMLAAGMTAATLVSTALSSPNINSAHATETGQLWVVGDESTIFASNAKRFDFREMNTKSGRIDFDNQRVYKFESPEKGFVEQEDGIGPEEIEKVRFKDVQFIGEKGWIVGSDGVMLVTADGGANWTIRKFGNYKFNSIRMVNENKGFIAADRGWLLTTKDGGNSWKVAAWEGQPNFTRIVFNKERGIITGHRGFILETFDYGDKWQMRRIAAAMHRNRYVNLNEALFAGEKRIWLLGDDGVILFSDNGGRTWTPKRFKEYSYYAACLIGPKEILAGGAKGVIIKTLNGGASWQEEQLPALRINSILRTAQGILAVGDAGMIMASKDNGETWRVIKKGRVFGYAIINFLAPFAFIWLLFLPAYFTLPNIKVPFKAAALGAAFTGAVWVVFILLFIVYIRQFAQGTFAVYGALAGIPLFLLMIYASSIIILLGAEVAYTVMYPESYRSLSAAFKEKNELSTYNGIALLQHIYEKFEKGRGPTSSKEMLKAVSVTAEDINEYIRIFTDEKLILINAESGFLPATSAESVQLNKVIDALMRVSLDLPAAAPGKTSSNILLGKLFNDIASSRRKVVGDLSLKDLIDRM
jgi:membrane protein